MDFRQRLEQSRNRHGNSEVTTEPESGFSCPYFGTDKNGNPACLELRLPDGRRKAIPYAFFTEINFDIDTGIEILTTGKRILITGRHLTRLFEHLTAYKVRYVLANVGYDTGDEDGVFVKEIIIDDL